LVLLDVAQEISDVVPTTTSNIDSPTIQQRRISSSVAVHNGETIALGGLIRDSKTRSRAGVPFASKIPLIGGLFGSTNNNNRRTELIVLITPRVIRNSDEARQVTLEYTRQFQSLQPMQAAAAAPIAEPPPQQPPPPPPPAVTEPLKPQEEMPRDH